MLRFQHFLFVVLALSVCGWSFGQAKPQSVLDDLVVGEELTMEKTEAGLVFKTRGIKAGRVQTKQTYPVPLTITLRAKTSTTDLALTYGETGKAILRDRMRPTGFRQTNPMDGRQFGVGTLNIAADEFVTLKWHLSENGIRPEVNGVIVMTYGTKLNGLTGTVGLLVTPGTVITVESLDVGPLELPELPRSTRPLPQPQPKPAATPPAGGGTAAPPATTPPSRSKDSINVDVPSNPPPAPEGFRTDGKIDADAIERPEFRYRVKTLDKSISTVLAMTVRKADNGELAGQVADIIATVPADSRRGGTASAGFYRKDGDDTMKASFNEAVRAITLRYPYWEPARIDIGFGEKFTGHAGPSAGTAFALLLLSTLEGFELDSRCAVTGDISVDWKVRKVGGVAAKLRGAALDKCDLAIIPEDNAGIISDLPLLYGKDTVYRLQVFSAGTLQEAQAVIRKDRHETLAEAIKLCGQVQAALLKDERVALKDPSHAKTLARVLELAPNHLTARQLLGYFDNTAARTLSSTATLYQLSVAFHPFAEILEAEKIELNRKTLPAATVATARKRLATLRPIAGKDLQPLIVDTAAMVEAMDTFANRPASATNLIRRWKQLESRYESVFTDRALMEKVLREGY